MRTAVTRVGWELDLSRCTQLRAVLAAHVLETVGPQEYGVDPARVLPPLERAFGLAARAEVQPHLSID